MYKPEKGDYVRAVLEGKITRSDEEVFVIVNTDEANSNCIHYKGKHVKSVEKIQEPLKEGDCCIFWDDNKNAGIICSIDRINRCAPYKYTTNQGYVYKRAERVPPEVADYFNAFKEGK